ncbi:unnamed protein product [Polarella glacialis]|uniref:AAA+ ATPase domain-containing protein n=1 Tax=Polarella glacialis TaxID=89957 RepID=A0A813DSB6_POLGL|nr:unnamed protein product [Polarella glacialis]
MLPANVQGKMLEQIHQARPQEALATLLKWRQTACAANGMRAGGSLEMKHYSTMLTDFGVCSSEAELLELLRELNPLVIYGSTAAATYMARFGSWVVRELLAEAAAGIAMAAALPKEALPGAPGGGWGRNQNSAGFLLAQSGKGGSGLFLEGNSSSLPSYHGFRKFDCVLVTPLSDGDEGTGSQGCRVGQDSLEAEVQQVPFPGGPQGLTVKLMGGMIPASVFGRECRVDKVANRVTHSRVITAMSSLCGAAGVSDKAEAAFRDLLLCEYDSEASGFASEASISGEVVETIAPRIHQEQRSLLAGCNPSQHLALWAGLQRRLTLVQGPPGTGKTFTAVRLVKLWLENVSGPVLVVADSNVAVDNLLEGCVAARLTAVRIGRHESTRPELEPYLLESQARAKLPRNSNGTERRELLFKEEMKILKSAQVVCATCSGSASGVLAQMRNSFTCVLVDEAAQVTEPVSLIPLMRSGVNQVALVGDHRQLPPTVLCQAAGSEGLGISLFDRLARRKVMPLLLDIQYRMHPVLAHHPSGAYYEGQLRSGVSGRSRPAPRGFQWPVPEVPMVFVPIQDGWEKSEGGTSQSNPTEADKVIQLVQDLLAAGEVTGDQIGVVSPYAAQVRLLKKRLWKVENAERVEICSVDGFQGREKEVIIVSTVRKNSHGQVGFVADPRRMNVMLTRARRGLIVCGDAATLARGDAEGWGKWLRWCWACGLYLGMPASSPQLSEEAFSLARKSEAELLPAAAAACPAAPHHNNNNTNNTNNNNNHNPQSPAAPCSPKPALPAQIFPPSLSVQNDPLSPPPSRSAPHPPDSPHPSRSVPHPPDSPHPSRSVPHPPDSPHPSRSVPPSPSLTVSQPPLPSPPTRAVPNPSAAQISTTNNNSNNNNNNNNVPNPSLPRQSGLAPSTCESAQNGGLSADGKNNNTNKNNNNNNKAESPAAASDDATGLLPPPLQQRQQQQQEVFSDDAAVLLPPPLPDLPESALAPSPPSTSEVWRPAPPFTSENEESGEAFLEAAPGAWECYRDAVGRRWWWNCESESCFYEPLPSAGS